MAFRRRRHGQPITERRSQIPLVSGIAELALEASDVGATVAFYSDLLGMPELSRDSGRVWLRAGETVRLGVWKPGEQEHGDRGGRHVHFALSASPGCLDALTHRLRDAGVPVEGIVKHDGGDRSIYFHDPAGNRVEVWDYFQRPPGATLGTEALGG